MAVMGGWNRQWIFRISFVVLVGACIVPLVVRSLLQQDGPSIQVEMADGSVRAITLFQMKELPFLTRDGSYQNQYGNWRDHGTYSGVLLSDLVQDHDYSSLEAVAEDGYRVTIARSRVEDSDYPMVLAFRMDGVDVPDWSDGFRIAVLPEDGGVSNVDYEAESAGSYWVSHVIRLILQSP